MGSVTPYETKSGRRYRARWWSDERKQVELGGFRTKRDAQQHLASVDVAMARGEYVNPRAARVTVTELAPAWLAKKRALKPSAYVPLETAWRVYVEPRWGDVAVGRIKQTAVEAWITEIGDGTAVTARVRRDHEGKPRSATTVLRALGVLAGILDDAVKDSRITKNPARGADNRPRKQSTKTRRYLTHDEVSRFAEAAPDATRSTLIRTLAYTGLRWGEAIGLRMRDLNMLRRRINVNRTATEVEGVIHVTPPKSWEKRSVPFPEFLAIAIARQCEGKGPDDLVFADATTGSFLSRPDTSESRQSWFLTSLRTAGLERLTPHDLRHTAASLAISAGANVKAVQRMLGHKSAAMTLDTYTDLFEDDLDAVAERLHEHASASTDVGKLWGQAR